MLNNIPNSSVLSRNLEVHVFVQHLLKAVLAAVTAMVGLEN